MANERFLIKPNIPNGKVCMMIISGEYPQINERLSEYTGIEKSSLYIKLRKVEAYHPDMQVCYLGAGKAVCLDNCALKERLEIMGLNVAEHQTANDELLEYPASTALNCLILGNYVIGRIGSISQKVRNYCEAEGYEFIDVKQGYTKCSVAVVNENSVITSDESIYNALKNKMDVLKIRSGYIDLPGYDYGFIGGCCGLIDKNVLAFTGDIKKHPDGNKILDFLKTRNIEYVSLTNDRLLDIGSLIPIKERI